MIYVWLFLLTFVSQRRSPRLVLARNSDVYTPTQRLHVPVRAHTPFLTFRRLPARSSHAPRQTRGQARCTQPRARRAAMLLLSLSRRESERDSQTRPLRPFQAHATIRYSTVRAATLFHGADLRWQKPRRLIPAPLREAFYLWRCAERAACGIRNVDLCCTTAPKT